MKNDKKTVILKKYFVSFVLILFTSGLANATESGPLSLQLPSAGETFNVANSPFAKNYENLEKQITSNISKGLQLLQLIGDFDYDVARLVAEQVNYKVKALINNSEAPDSTVGVVKQYLPTWALPIYQYAEGIPESAVIGNLGKVDQTYEKVNKELRDKVPDSRETTEFVQKLRDSLPYLPKYEGISFRGARLKQEQMEEYFSIGKLAKDAAFVSTSILSDVALRFALANENSAVEEYQKIGVIFVFKGKTGRPVSMLADDHYDEAEILFANGTQFLVVSKSPLFKLPEKQGFYQIVYLIESPSVVSAK